MKSGGTPKQRTALKRYAVPFYVYSAALLAVGVGLFYFLREPPAWTSYFVANGDERVEVYQTQPTLGRPWPVVILLHGEQEKRVGGEVFAKDGTLERLSDKGFIAVAVSQPGYGASSGRADFAGPIAQKALHAVIADLRARPEVRFGKVAVVGVGRGAVLAGNVAAADPMLAGVVVIDGVLNFRKTLPKWRADERKKSLAKVFEQEAGLTKQAYRERSLAMQSRPLKVPILSLDETEDEDRRYLFSRLKKRNVEAQSLKLPADGRGATRKVGDHLFEIVGFLESVLR